MVSESRVSSPVVKAQWQIGFLKSGLTSSWLLMLPITFLPSIHWLWVALGDHLLMRANRIFF